MCDCGSVVGSCAVVSPKTVKWREHMSAMEQEGGRRGQGGLTRLCCMWTGFHQICTLLSIPVPGAFFHLSEAF